MLTGRDAAHKRIADLFAKGEGAAARRRFPQSRHLLRRPGRSGARRSGGARGPDHRDAHGQVHRDDAREDRAHRHGRQGRARSRRHRGHPQASRGLSDGRGRRGLPRVEGHQGLARGGVRGSRHGSDLRIHRRGHAGDRGRRCERHLGAPDRSGRVEPEDRRRESTSRRMVTDAAASTAFPVQAVHRRAGTSS